MPFLGSYVLKHTDALYHMFYKLNFSWTQQNAYKLDIIVPHTQNSSTIVHDLNT